MHTIILLARVQGDLPNPHSEIHFPGGIRHNHHMQRTTIVAEERLLEQLREIARRENISFAQAIRQGLEWRVAQASRHPQFIGGARATDGPHDFARRAGELKFEPTKWR
jgi:hypothetical protein